MCKDSASNNVFEKHGLVASKNLLAGLSFCSVLPSKASFDCLISCLDPKRYIIYYVRG